MLQLYGTVRVGPEWEVAEKTPCGFLRVYFIRDGEVAYAGRERTITLKRGFLYIFPSASAYTLTQDRRKRLFCTFLHLDVFPLHVTELIEIDPDGDPLLRQILLALAAAVDADDRKILYALSDVFEMMGRERGWFAAPDGSIEKVLLYIAGHMDEDLSVGRLSRLAGYSGQYFIRHFKRLVGMTPHRYIIRCRLREAERKLRAGVAPAEIARLTGYGDAARFGRAFRKEFGMPPGAWRDSRGPMP